MLKRHSSMVIPLLLVSICLLFPRITLAGQDITIDQTVFFPSPDGEPRVVVQGTYKVSASEGMLYLDPGEGEETIGLLAEVTTHTDTLTTPEAISFYEKDGDSQFVMLSFPDGKRLTAVGSYTYGAVRSRGLSFTQDEKEGREKTVDTSITITRPTHFLNSNGEPVIVAEGPYRVVGGEGVLHLFSLEDEEVTIKAEAIGHEYKLEHPTAFIQSDQDEESEHLQLVLLLPDGTGREAVGSFTGVQSRGFFSNIGAKLKEMRLKNYTLAVKNGLLLDKGTKCLPAMNVLADWDGDCIPDAKERQLSKVFAPEVRLHPKDWTRPSSVDWFLKRVKMGFHHDNCPDETILQQGSITFKNIAKQTERDKGNPVWHRCGRKSYIYKSWEDWQFYLHRTHSNTMKGSEPNDWQAVVHAIPVTQNVKVGTQYRQVFTGFIEIQYWFFYPYNDTEAPKVNHEGDWEGMAVVVNPNGEFASAKFFAHGKPTRFTKSQLKFVNNTCNADECHPIVYSSKGTHASYPTPGVSTAMNYGLGEVKDRRAEGGPKWQTWKRLLNPGERDPIKREAFTFIHVGEWIHYSGLWGELGNWFSRATGIPTTGPVGPAFKVAKWCPNGVTIDQKTAHCRHFGQNYAPE